MSDAAPHQTGQADVRPRASSSIAAMLEIDDDGTVVIYSGKVELGTGIATALTQIVAEELGVSPQQTRIVMGDTDRTPDLGTTAGSKTIQGAGPLLRRAAIGARRELLARAADRLECAPDDLTIVDGVIRPVDGSGRSVPFADLAGTPFRNAVPEHVDNSPPARRRIVGHSHARVDLHAKVTGGEAHIQDVRLDRMAHGRVVRPYVRTMAGAGRLLAVDDAAARTIPGVIDVVRSGDFLGVVAETEWAAIRAAEALEVTWDSGDPIVPHGELHDAMRRAPTHDTEPLHRGDVPAALAIAPRTMSATYRFPMQAHASIGPSCAVADVTADRAVIYSSSQGVYALRDALAPILGLPAERIRVIFREGAGCYGHNGADDVCADAALLSRAVGRPVRVQWMRQDEFAWEPKSPAMVVDMEAGLDDRAMITAWQHTAWTPTHTLRPGGQPGNLLAAQQVDPPFPPAQLRFGGGDRNAPTTYTFRNERVTMHWLADAPLRPSAMRSLGGLHNTTANECFLDEIAHATGVDPVAMRLRLLDDPRAIDVVRVAADRAGWGHQVSPIPGRKVGRGIAYARYEAAYAYVAIVAEVAVEVESGAVRVTRIVVAHDCGMIVNPDGVRSQIEGNVVQGIGRSLSEDVTWDSHAVTSLTWDGYRIPTFPDIPAIDIHMIDRPDQPSWGAGEPAICPVTAAIGNAIHDATGIRLRQVPFTPDRVRTALAGTIAPGAT
jgi:CO/xanthine dehydrogenase Mo-binding subunit